VTTIYDVARVAGVSTADAPDAVARQVAFEQAVAATPDSGIDQVIHGDFSEDSGVAAARLLLGRTTLPQAVACANDQMAIGAVRELQRAGVRVPADVAVTGFDDLYPSRIIDPPLTTVSQPIHELGRRATHRLMARIASPGLAPRAEILPTQIVIRTSCGCPATGLARAAQSRVAAEPKGEAAWDST
jgi:LacI family transcriptional regulator